MDVDAAAVLLRELEDAVHLPMAELRRRLVVRDATDAVGTEPQGVLEQLLVRRMRIDPVLRKGRDLDRHQLRELVTYPQEPAQRRLVLRRHVGMRADVKRALRRRPAHDLARPLENVVGGEALLQLSPDVDAFDQRSGLVVAWPAGGQGGVEMKMAIDERRSGESPARVQALVRIGIEVGPDLREAPA